MTTKHFTIEPRGYGHSPFGQPTTGPHVQSNEFKTKGFGDPRTIHTINNNEGTGGTPTYTPETIPATAFTDTNEN